MHYIDNIKQSKKFLDKIAQLYIKENDIDAMSYDDMQGAAFKKVYEKFKKVGWDGLNEMEMITIDVCFFPPCAYPKSGSLHTAMAFSNSACAANSIILYRHYVLGEPLKEFFKSMFKTEEL